MKKVICLFVLLIVACLAYATKTSTSQSESRTNSIGMQFVKIPAGSFIMGNDKGDWDEKPLHNVTISKEFWITVSSVTNEQYEKFDPNHHRRWGERQAADDYVAYVSWYDAVAFCEWLSKKEGKPYRLPTEAEWEYVRRNRPELFQDDVQYENWCYDWYGPYISDEITDPIGYYDGDIKVTRGGPYKAGGNLPNPSNRLGNVPEDRNRVVSFRIVQGFPVSGKALTSRPEPRWARNVKQDKYDWSAPCDMKKPFFGEPVGYVKIPAGSRGPLFTEHNHVPGITYCLNGDLLAVWYSTIRETGRELAIAACRLRLGSKTWEEADVFWDVSDRNDHAPAVWHDGRGTLYHFNGLAVEGGWQDLALLMRTSRDNGATWSKGRLINPIHGFRNMPIAGIFKTKTGAIFLPCDAIPGGSGGTVLYISRDDGKSWNESGYGKPKPEFQEGKIGAWVAGIHAAVAEWEDGSLIAVGRGDNINGKMPMSISKDGGKTWTYSATPFPPIGGGQRPVLRRLNEGPLMLVSFTPNSAFKDANGNLFMGRGMFAALSMDGGKSWPIMKLITDGKQRTLNGQAWTKEFTMDANHAEPKGYLAAVQTPDNMIHLISSGIYYHFNLAWLKQPPEKVGAVDTENSIGMKLISIPAGSFIMGNEIYDQWDRRPVHKVSITKPFMISETEVTLDQYQKFKPDYNVRYEGFASAVNWYDAVAFCEWLSKKEGKPYRLPTEAEWEYAALEKKTPPAAKDVQTLYISTTDSQARYNLYSKKFGPGDIILGGNHCEKTRTKAHYIPFIIPDSGTCKVEIKYVSSRKQYQVASAKENSEVFIDRKYVIEKISDKLAGSLMIKCANDDETFETDRHIVFSIDRPVTVYVAHADQADRVPKWLSGYQVLTSVGDDRPSKYNFWGLKNMYDGLLEWCSDWYGQYPADEQVDPVGPEQGKTKVIRGGVEQTENYSGTTARLAVPPAMDAGMPPNVLSVPIGFRVVQAPMPKSKPLPVVPFYVTRFVKPVLKENLKKGPDLNKPFFRKYRVLPVPPDGHDSREEIDYAGLHPSFRGHNHSPAMEVCPNGDLLVVTYTSYTEYEPGVSLIASRLRYGASQWEMPGQLFDFVGINDHAPLLWNDNGKIWLFWGSPDNRAWFHSPFPFQWATSDDSGAGWSNINLPRFTNKIGSHTKQPVNTAFRDGLDTMFVVSDGVGGQSVLWASKDDGKNWYDTGGRTNGRHTTCVLLKDGRIMGMGGKNSDVDGFMPVSISADGGRMWKMKKSPFPALGNRQRPSVLRLQSGRLLMVGDLISNWAKTRQMDEFKNNKGGYVALSEDEGQTWVMKKLPETRPLGYTVARQSPNGLIHILLSLNMELYTLNEAWILDKNIMLRTDENEIKDAELRRPTAAKITGVKEFAIKYPDGKIKAAWNAGTGSDGCYLLHGPEIWYGENGKKQYEVSYKLGMKTGTETLWRQDGSVEWKWQHNEDGISTWTQYWPNGRKKAESAWREHYASGPAKTWDRDGNLLSSVVFENGKIRERLSN